MKFSTHFFFLFIVFFNVVTADSQIKKALFNRTVATVIGDLNKDGRKDLVIVKQDTGSDTLPYRLQVFFMDNNKKYLSVLVSDSCIQPAFPDGRNVYDNGVSFDTVLIENGVLTIKTNLLRGWFQHQFRYQHNRFELIGYTEVSSNGLGEMDFIDFNLSTGKRSVRTENYETEKLISKQLKIIRIRPLPNLKYFKPMDNDYY
ncbi:MAG: hypothetical protein ABJA78_13435 [Ferruginibacter sp.]